MYSEKVIEELKCGNVNNIAKVLILEQALDIETETDFKWFTAILIIVGTNTETKIFADKNKEILIKTVKDLLLNDFGLVCS